MTDTAKSKSFLNAATEYLRAADVLTHSYDYVNEARLRRPTLYLLSHGIEALCKYQLILAGFDDKKLKEINHDLYQLWNRCEISSIREQVIREAKSSWEKAYQAGAIDSQKYKENPVSILQAQIPKLASLYGKETGFSLKYDMPDGTEAPRAPFLIACFLPVAQKLAAIT